MAPTDQEGISLPISLAMVPLSPNGSLNSTAMTADLALKWPALPKIEAGETTEEMFAFRVGNQEVIIATMPAPIPWADLEGPCATSWLWPDAAKILEQHQQHLVVTALSDQGPIERATLLTQVLASVLATCPEAVGLYWGAATLVVPSALFQEFTTKVLPIGLPVHLWVDVRVGQSPGGPSTGFTVGLSALGHMEFETLDSPVSPGELRERLFHLADYVLTNGPVIRDGNTVGKDAHQRIRVVYSASAFGHPGQVMRLEHQNAAAKKPWWKPC
jgi:uncharacterized protein DUF4261